MYEDNAVDLETGETHPKTENDASEAKETSGNESLTRDEICEETKTVEDDHQAPVLPNSSPDESKNHVDLSDNATGIILGR